ncbi:MAG: hypothetical protein GEU26_11515 [Nitrososphaeraceae archaeon]|nr:hypothetical protein [Nitrososphaeraceae archaeon]
MKKLALFPLVILFFISYSAYGTTNQTTNQTTDVSNETLEITNTTSNDISLNVVPESSEYTELQSVEIFVRVYTEEGGLRKLVLEVRNSSGQVVHESSQLINVNKWKFFLHPGQVGTYNVTVKAIQNGNDEEVSTSFNVVSIYNTSTVRFLLISVASFVGLLILITVAKRDNATQEVLRFVFLSGIVVSILLSFIFTGLEIGKGSPIGLTKVDANQTGIESSSDQWVFNVGGELYIPIYVVVFGLIGGYLRYLYKTSRLLIDEDLRKEKEDMKKYLIAQGITDVTDLTQRLIFFESLRDVALFFLSPILAVVVWFLFSQWEPIAGSPTILAVFSFASGLVTTEIVNAISNFTKSNLSKRTAPSG